jgi:hypothetical protein
VEQYLGRTLMNQILLRKKLKAHKSQGMLSFGAESFVLQFTIQNYKD